MALSIILKFWTAKIGLCNVNIVKHFKCCLFYIELRRVAFQLQHSDIYFILEIPHLVLTTLSAAAIPRSRPSSTPLHKLFSALATFSSYSLLKFECILSNSLRRPRQVPVGWIFASLLRFQSRYLRAGEGLGTLVVDVGTFSAEGEVTQFQLGICQLPVSFSHAANTHFGGEYSYLTIYIYTYLGNFFVCFSSWQVFNGCPMIVNCSRQRFLRCLSRLSVSVYVNTSSKRNFFLSLALAGLTR